MMEDNKPEPATEVTAESAEEHQRCVWICYNPACQLQPILSSVPLCDLCGLSVTVVPLMVEATGLQMTAQSHPDECKSMRLID